MLWLLFALLAATPPPPPIENTVHVIATKGRRLNTFSSRRVSSGNGVTWLVVVLPLLLLLLGGFNMMLFQENKAPIIVATAAENDDMCITNGNATRVAVHVVAGARTSTSVSRIKIASACTRDRVKGRMKDDTRTCRDTCTCSENAQKAQKAPFWKIHVHTPAIHVLRPVQMLTYLPPSVTVGIAGFLGMGLHVFGGVVPGWMWYTYMYLFLGYRVGLGKTMSTSTALTTALTGTRTRREKTRKDGRRSCTFMVWVCFAATLLMVDVVRAVFAPADKAALKAAVRTCLSETADGSCPTFAGSNATRRLIVRRRRDLGNSYGVIGDWDVSAVTSMGSSKSLSPPLSALCSLHVYALWPSLLRCCVL
jgi:hypothetical protein